MLRMEGGDFLRMLLNVDDESAWKKGVSVRSC